MERYNKMGMEFIKELTKKKDIEMYLEFVLKKIKFLESMYMTNRENKKYSERFGDEAHRERQELCQISSECYEKLRKLS